MAPYQLVQWALNSLLTPIVGHPVFGPIAFLSVTAVIFGITIYCYVMLMFIFCHLLADLVPRKPSASGSPARMIDCVLRPFTVLKNSEDICAICRDSFTRPVQLLCGHVFCEICIRHTLSGTNVPNATADCSPRTLPNIPSIGFSL